ncbi:uncharacterized protein LACBIDRAFT_304107 [Laccaria bicolor S238N-H82]|uniref:Predicted protein n=1 Tax=Laccaria bicolor (strain S238N-H82 / ATCC MYA-4686) TaxID=486041 RepID=B0DKY9_LACBS|nr:uncharacterized protein LACBIDRAFT_304107 [Laccaria bicolor S238N-H82]EDR04732.1 predicted protein [Laccaria bicolor S238N-H82]|eukprot:XP_001884556.1 predicted protein [Laccaria bicolor S238N-H82]
MSFQFLQRLIGPALVTVGVATLLPVAGLGLLTVLGFGAGGIVAGSLAASIQSAVYGAFTCGVFATCTSIAATAAAPAAGGIVASVLSMVAGLGLWLW